MPFLSVAQFIFLDRGANSCQIFYLISEFIKSHMKICKAIYVYLFVCAITFLHRPYVPTLSLIYHKSRDEIFLIAVPCYRNYCKHACRNESVCISPFDNRFQLKIIFKLISKWNVVGNFGLHFIAYHRARERVSEWERESENPDLRI